MFCENSNNPNEVSRSLNRWFLLDRRRQWLEDGDKNFKEVPQMVQLVQEKLGSNGEKLSRGVLDCICAQLHASSNVHAQRVSLLLVGAPYPRAHSCTRASFR